MIFICMIVTHVACSLTLLLFLFVFYCIYLHRCCNQRCNKFFIPKVKSVTVVLVCWRVVESYLLSVWLEWELLLIYIRIPFILFLWDRSLSGGVWQFFYFLLLASETGTLMRLPALFSYGHDKAITQGVNHTLIPWSFSSLLHMSFHRHCNRLPTGQTAKIPMPSPCDSPRSFRSFAVGQPAGRQPVTITVEWHAKQTWEGPHKNKALGA